jgi:uncharacterized protein YbjQ (UPF0145 family)
MTGASHHGNPHADSDIPITSGDTVPGREIAEICGIARGSIVRARFVGRDFIAGLRNLVGGEINEYSTLMSESREQALLRMIAHARELGADAIIAFRFSSSTVMEGAAETLAYGTAVKLK